MFLLYLVNATIFLFTAVIYILCFRRDGSWNKESGLLALRFFTTLSNLLAGFASLLILFTLRPDGLPRIVWLLKYLAAASVAVTFLTVMVFLGPAFGYRSQLEGSCFYLHVTGPLLTVVSFCFFERFYPLHFSTALLGLLPVICYGLLYLHKVVRTAAWDDFYGFNRDGKWQRSFAAMVAGTLCVCLLLWFLSRI